MLKLLLLSLGIILILGVGRTWQIQHKDISERFLAGILPNPALGGFLRGSVPGYTFSWQGKKFDSSTATGINVFKDGTSLKEKYPFKTYAGKGLQDKDLEVLKIDYDVPPNPFWLRRIVDEVVEVAPGEYLGKLHVRVIPNIPFSLSYFELKKTD